MLEQVPANMLDKAKAEIKDKPVRMAICYDFDKTLSPDDMQSFTLIPSFGIDKNEFWQESNQLAHEHLMDNNLAWMYKLLEHYIISSGLKEIIEGSKIAAEFRKIYASTYLYNADGVAVWPAQAVNYTNKTQYIFRIAKGIFEEYDERVNATMLPDQLYIPYENIVYIGDSATDIPCMRLVKSKGGYSVGVFDPQSRNKDRVYQLFADGRINFYAPADYTSKSQLTSQVKLIINAIATRSKINIEQAVLKVPTQLYTIKQSMQFMSGLDGVTKKDKREMEEFVTELGSYLSEQDT